MQVLIAERKGAAGTCRPGRVPFEEAVRSATVLVLCCTSTESSRHTIGGPELAAMRPEAVVINVARGGIVDAAALVRALRERKISGAAVDVFDREPASSVEDSDLFLLGEGEGEGAADLNLTFSPHVGYFSTKTLRTMRAMVKGHIKSHIEGDYSKFEA